MAALHSRGLVPPALKQYRVETVKTGVNTLTISTSLDPYGPYNIHARGDLRNAEGKLAMTITLESGDGDQPGFAKEFPKEAAQGMRRFSIDAYAETGLNPAGQRTQTHYTFKFLTGQPDYATIREQFLDIANGKAHPLSSRTGLIVQ
jgi:hypothetical protein